jgi:hypothetical protein
MVADVVNAALEISERFGRLATAVERLERRELDSLEQLDFATPALALRFPGRSDYGMQPGCLLVARRKRTSEPCLAGAELGSRLKVSGLRGQPLIDIVSYARRGPGRRDRLAPAELPLISRTVLQTPEVMVKALPQDSNNLRTVVRHLNYISRYGDLGLDTDEGDHIQGKNAGQLLVEDWDLDLNESRLDLELPAAVGRARKLVHKIMLSMPPGTPPKGVRTAVRNFAREEFALKHRYALVLHTDEPHPHVHLVVKAVSEHAVRLNISKATLREWRREFARHLRDQGIAANATERAIRRETRTRKLDGLYRASLRGESTHMRARGEAVVRELAEGGVQVEQGKADMLRTRAEILHAWRVISDILIQQEQTDLGQQVRRFAENMPLPGLRRRQSPTSGLSALVSTQNASDIQKAGDSNSRVACLQRGVSELHDRTIRRLQGSPI